jgi:hypothetical protein
MSMQQAISSCGVNLEAYHAQLDAQAVVREYGQRIVVKVRDETNVTRDSYNSIKKRPTNKSATGTFGAYPVEYQPTERQLEKAGLRERCDVSVWIPVLDFQDLGFTFADIDATRSTVIVDGEEFQIKDKARASQFAGSWLYYTLGLSKK